ncbi:hypothetical protein [Natronorubrum sp. FCH18a]|uniref:hypothetical protein n=1 Tax=Natronorubrum sp. FCH18a TaxID=3447018 RepID=UPI003F512859
MTPEPTQDDGILTPEELQLEDDNVAKLSENCYPVQSDGTDTAAEMPVTPRRSPRASTRLPRISSRTRPTTRHTSVSPTRPNRAGSPSR